MTGRPSKYSEELADRVCMEIAIGKSVHALCEGKGMPSPATIFAWLTKHPTFLDKYVRARKERTNARFERLDQVIQDLRNGIIDHKVARVEIDVIKWQLGKENANKYGDRMIHAGDADAPLVTEDVTKSEKQAFDRFVKNYGKKDDENYDDIC